MSEPTENKLKAQPDNSAALAAELAGTMPEVTVVPPADAAAGGAAPATEFPPDSLGRPWDAARFRAGADGKPRCDTLGRFINIKSGRRKAGVSAGGSYIPPEPAHPPPGAQDGAGGAAAPAGAAPAAAPGAPPPSAPVNNTAAAEVLTRGLYTAAGALTGVPEEARPAPGDHENLKAVTASALDACGLRVGVGLGLVVGLLGYVLMVVNRPKTYKALAGKIADWKAARAKKVEPVEPAAAPPQPPRAYEKVPPVAHEMPAPSPPEVPPAALGGRSVFDI
jgi:hypothetical protein